MLGIIYKHTCTITGKYYIGQRVQHKNIKKNKQRIKIQITSEEALELRWKRHIKDSKKENPKQYFHRSIKKYGEENFTHEILEENIPIFLYIDNDSEKKINHLSNREMFWIWKYKANNSKFGYNMTIGGEGISGLIRSEEYCKNISESKKGSKNPMFGKTGVCGNKGKKRSQESKKKQSESMKHRVRSEEYCKNISESKKGSKNPMSKENQVKRLGKILMSFYEQGTLWNN